MSTRVLLVATTTGYQTRAFGQAAERLGVQLVFATDRCAVLEDPWRDAAIPVRFHEPAASVKRIRSAAEQDGLFAAVVAVGDRPAVLAAHAREALGLEGHHASAADAARHKLKTRECLRHAGLPVPRFVVAPVSSNADSLARDMVFPAVLKPVSLSGSRGVMRVNDATELAAAIQRLRRILARPDIRGERDVAHDLLLMESFIEGHEYAIEGVMTGGRLQTLAIFDKPDPLNGPFFEETIYLTVPSLQTDASQRIIDAVAAAAAAIGLHHGPVHAECRVNSTGVFVLEVAARPIGGICARSLRFERRGEPDAISLEELLLRHALGEDTTPWRRESCASGVMMIPIPKRGIYRRVSGTDAARSVAGIDDVVITAREEQRLMPLPEGASYLGFIFARADTPERVDQSLREAHQRLAFVIDVEVPVLQSANG
jgi:carbamoylphosphate synthase large subunit